jgi:hypothetical protein
LPHSLWFHVNSAARFGHTGPSSDIYDDFHELLWEIALKAVSFACIYIVRCLSKYERSFGLDIGFIDHFNTRPVITLNYSATVDVHTLQITVTHIHTLMFSVCY